MALCPWPLGDNHVFRDQYGDSSTPSQVMRAAALRCGLYAMPACCVAALRCTVHCSGVKFVFLNHNNVNRQGTSVQQTEAGPPYVGREDFELSGFQLDFPLKGALSRRGPKAASLGGGLPGALFRSLGEANWPRAQVRNNGNQDIIMISLVMHPLSRVVC